MVLSGAANRVSKNEFSNFCSFQGMTFFKIFPPFFHVKYQDFKKKQKSEIPKLLVGCTQVTLSGCKYGIQRPFKIRLLDGFSQNE